METNNVLEEKIDLAQSDNGIVAESINSEKQKPCRFGKFTTADELLRGYEELEKSYTKKCQELSKLKNQTGGTSEQTPPQAEQAVAQTVSDGKTPTQPKVQDAPNASYVKATDEQKNSAQSTDCSAATNGQEESCRSQTQLVESLQQFLRQNPDIARNLLQKTATSDVAPRVIGSGGALGMAEPVRAKSLGEASRLALKSFSEK